jgi:uncharacterized damage-inducible protein DinB
VKGPLLDIFRHNSWATKELLATCQVLTPAQLNTSVTGSFGNILQTFNHLIICEARYQHFISGSSPAWGPAAQESNDFDQLFHRADDVERYWEELFSQGIDTEKILWLENGTYRTYVGLVIAQAIHHGTLHREQISAILTHLGIAIPDLQPWGYGFATGRGLYMKEA